MIQLLGYPVISEAANVDEESITLSDPALNVVQTAVLKAEAIAEKVSYQNGRSPVIIAADTTVALKGEMLGKPTGLDDARQMLRKLRGRSHEVHTGLTLIDSKNNLELKGVHTAVVTMRPYSNDEIEAYIATRDPLDKAGAYAIQHPVFKPVSHLDGCFTGVMGLSICHLIQLLQEAGIPALASFTAVEAAHQGYSCPLLTEISPLLN